MGTLTKAEMAERLHIELGLNKKDAKSMADWFFEEIRLALESGISVKLSGFGNFEIKHKRQRPGRNPKTGEEVAVSARSVVTFKPGQKLRDRVDAYTDESEVKQ